MQWIKLMKSTFYGMPDVKQKLADFIMNAEKLSMGEHCENFESKFANYQGRKHSVFFNSGSSANLAIIQALCNLGKLKVGDEVAFSALTWSTNVMPIMQLGLRAVPIDMELDTLNVSSTKFLQVLKENPQIKAFFITNVLGFCDDLDEIETICKERNIILLEDNCESFGSVYKGRKLGNYSLASSFSFYVGHHMSTIEGGSVCTDDYPFYNMLKMVRAHGWDRNLDEASKASLRKDHSIDAFYGQYAFYELGYNLRPMEINAFVGLEQLNYADEIVSKRVENFNLFQKISSRNEDFYKLNVDHMDVVSNFAFPVICKSKDTLHKYINLFNSQCVEIRPIVGGNMARQPFFAKFGGVQVPLPNSDIAHVQGFYLPNNPELTQNELDRIVHCLEPEPVMLSN